MRRLSHDLPGIGQRIVKAHEQLQTAIGEVREVWKDERSRDFFQRYTAEIPTTVQQLASKLSSAVEAFESMSRSVQDPDRR